MAHFIIINNTSVPILFADDTSILFTHHKNDSLNTNKHNTFPIINKWFKANLPSSNYAKTHCVQFRTKNAMQIDSKIAYGNNIIWNVSHTKLLVLAIDSTLSSSTHIEGTVNKLSSVCCMFRSVKPCMSHSSLITIYYALFHSSMSYGIIFWGNSSNKQKIFKLQKRAIRTRTHVEIYLNSWQFYCWNHSTFFPFF